MDVRSYLRPILTGLVGLGIVVLLIVLIVKIFSGGGSSPSKQIDLGQYQNTGATATLLVDAPTNDDQDHRQVRITISQTTNEIDTIQGYQGNLIDSRTYPSNSAAFGAFLQSLKLMNYTKGNATPSDYRGYCPQGDRYVYSFNDGQKDLFTYWSTSCHQGTFKGSSLSVLQLYRAEIPQKDFDTLTGAIPLGF